MCEIKTMSTFLIILTHKHVALLSTTFHILLKSATYSGEY